VSFSFTQQVPIDVIMLFEKLTLEVIAAGHQRYSSDAVLHRIRWYFTVERGDREFKCNNNWTPELSRWFMYKHPQYDGFFATRVRRR